MKTSMMFGKLLTNKWVGYVIAVGAVALATFLKMLAQPNIIPSNVPILYFLAIVAFFGVNRPGFRSKPATLSEESMPLFRSNSATL